MNQVLKHKLARRLAWQQRLNDPRHEKRLQLPNLGELKRWQSARLRQSFRDVLQKPHMRPAGEFFLTDLYADRDFSARDRDAARILPMMARILPMSLLEAAVDAIELAVLSQAFDFAVAEALWPMQQQKNKPVIAINQLIYANAYRDVACPRLRRHQIGLIVRVGEALDAAVKKHGVYKLLKASRLPARLAGLHELQGFLERGFEAFAELNGADDFLQRVSRAEYEVSARLFSTHPEPFATEA
jgi:hypothetical protein